MHFLSRGTVKLLSLIEFNSQMKHREVVLAGGVSLGKANCYINSLNEIGIVKAQNYQK